MSFARLLDREVVIIPQIAEQDDGARGNDAIFDGDPIPGVPAGRDLEQADEKNDASDLQSSRYVYFFGPDVPLSGFDVIVDDGHRYSVKGPPERVVRRRGGRVHHVEAVAYYIGPQ